MVKIFARKQSVHFINSVENETVQIKTTTTKKKQNCVSDFSKRKKISFLRFVVVLDAIVKVVVFLIGN